MRSNSDKQTSVQVGESAEKFALSYLQSKGLTLIVSNYSCRYGEIDLIMQHDDSLVFVEVRYRKYHQYGSGAESVNYHKQQKIIRSAETFLQRNKKYNRYPCRIDVVSIGPGDTTIDWIRNAIER